MARPKLGEREQPERTDETPPPGFIPSGSYLLDLVLGGQGWSQSKMANLVGDKSTGKTLLAIEACANMARITRPEFIRYGEGEEAFDEPYAQSVGCPRGIRLSAPGALRTVEDFYEDFKAFLNTVPPNVPSMYVLDSLDSLSSEAELERDFNAGSYGDGKAKQLSKLFRMLISDMREKNCFLLVISQIRDKLNVTFGETKTRSGGHALDFYASQIVWLAQVSTLSRTVHNIKRPYGVQIKIKNKKCKVGTPFRDAELPLLFNYGMDDETSMVDWLKETKRPIVLDGISYGEKDVSTLIAELRTEQDRAGLAQLNRALRENVGKVWSEIEDKLKQPMSKYAP